MLPLATDGKMKVSGSLKKGIEVLALEKHPVFTPHPTADAVLLTDYDAESHLCG